MKLGASLGSMAIIAALTSSVAFAQATPPYLGAAAPYPGAAMQAPPYSPTAPEPGAMAAFQAHRRQHFMSADINRDGRISLQEWLAFRSKSVARGGNPTLQFQHLDLNHDGYLTPNEIDASSAKMFARRVAKMGGAPPGEFEPE